MPMFAIRLSATTADTYQLIDDIFSGRRDIRNDTFVPHGATGIWTSIALIYQDNHSETVKNIDTSRDLRQIYAFVTSRCAT
jgi:hypothetical protein